jgi:hypothetical protein
MCCKKAVNSIAYIRQCMNVCWVVGEENENFLLRLILTGDVSCRVTLYSMMWGAENPHPV